MALERNSQWHTENMVANMERAVVKGGGPTQIYIGPSMFVKYSASHSQKLLLTLICEYFVNHFASNQTPGRNKI